MAPEADSRVMHTISSRSLASSAGHSDVPRHFLPGFCVGELHSQGKETLEQVVPRRAFQIDPWNSPILYRRDEEGSDRLTRQIVPEQADRGRLGIVLKQDIEQGEHPGAIFGLLRRQVLAGRVRMRHDRPARSASRSNRTGGRDVIGGTWAGSIPVWAQIIVLIG